MLSRRTSNMIFYSVLLGITLVVVVARLILIGNLNNKIDDTTVSNRSLQSRISTLELNVQNYKEYTSDHLYELFDKVPEIYDQDALSYYTEAQLELIGITEDFEVNRVVDIDDEILFQPNSTFEQMQNDFKIVEVYVYFETAELDVVDQFIDRLYSSEQVFVVSEIEFSNFNSGSEVGVNVTFLAFYQLEE